MIALRISHSLLSGCTPGYRMLRDLPCILSIGSIRVVVLVGYDYRFRLSLGISHDIEKYSDMLLTRICEGVVRLSVEAGDHESLIL